MPSSSKLTATTCKNAKPKDDGKPRTLSDGHGLFLKVSSNSKRWRFDYQLHGKRRSLSLGTFPDVSLIEAREDRSKARELVRAGRDPVAVRKMEKQQGAGNTFDAVSKDWLSNGQAPSNWQPSHRRTVEQRLAKNLLPELGSFDVKHITPPLILDCLRKIESRGAIETAHRCKYIVSQVMRYAVVTGRITSDPTRDLRDALKAPTPKRFAHITDPARLGEVLRAIDGYNGSPTVKAALQLLPLTFVRSGELRCAKWDEIDLRKRIWVIPAERMKRSANGDHTIHLSRQATEILSSIKLLNESNELVFAGIKSPNRPISDGTLNAALRRLDIAPDELVAHGFRHTASTLLNELRFDQDLIEAQLHHAGSGMRRIYNSAQYLKQRKSMMTEWADYLDSLRDGAKVLKLGLKHNV